MKNKTQEMKARQEGSQPLAFAMLNQMKGGKRK